MIVQFAEEDRRPTQPTLRRPPPVPAAEQHRLGPGERDIAEAAFLPFQVAVTVGGELGEVGFSVATQHRQLVGVPAQRRGQHRRRCGPLRPDGSDRKNRVAEIRHSHDLPLQPLGLVNGHQLDRIRAGGAGRVQTTVVFLRGLQERQKRADRTVVVQAGEAGRDVDERGEVVTAAGCDRLAARRQFHIQAGDLDDPVDDVQQRLVDMSAQVTQVRAEHPQPGPALSRHLRTRVVQYVGERDHIAGVDPENRLVKRIRPLSAHRPLGSRLVEEGGAPRPGSGGLARRTPERGEITTAQTDPRAGEQPGQGGVGRRVVQYLQRRDDIGDLRQAQQTAKAHDLHGQLPRKQRRIQRGDVTARPHEYRALPGPGPPGGDDLPKRRRDPADLL